MQRMSKMKNMRTALLFLLVAMISLSVSAQNVTVKGTVKDKTGETVIGASVVQKGNTGNGTITDIDGNFTLSVPANSTLVISYVGMKTQEITLKGQTKINVVLDDDSQALDEVVVIGYGTVQKKDLTGSVASVSAKQLSAVPVSNASEALQGKMAGVQITQTEGSPDADIRIRVRGGGSLSQDNSPLYIVDGFPVSSIGDIAPSDIQSVDVLKDASSTAIYGARGANGVIIITTKSGKEGKIEVNAGVSFGIRKMAKHIDVMDPYNYVLYQYELVGGQDCSYGDWQDLDIYKSIKGTDWQDELWGRTGNQQAYNVSVSGGTKDTKFNISYSRNDEKSIMQGSGFSKNNINAKINTKINKWLSFDFNARLTHQKIDGLSGGSDNDTSASNSLVARSIIYAPIEVVDTSDDDENATSTRYDPLQRLNDTYKRQTRFRQNYNGGINWEPVKGLTFRSEFGYGWKFDNTDQVWGSIASVNSKYKYDGAPQAYISKVNNKNWRIANTLTYENKSLFNKRDRLNVMIGQETSSSKDNSTYLTAVNFESTATPGEVLANLGNGTSLPTKTYIGIKDNLNSYFGRINYTLMDRYLFTFTMRADGSSKFAKGNQWGYFPSGAFAWRVYDESFMQGTHDWLSNLKLRLSLGTSGNNRIPSGAMYTTYSLGGTSSSNIYFNEQASIILQPGDALSNPNLKWETTISRNLGLDFGFLNNRLSGSLDFYWNTTKDLLMKTTIPAGSGYSYQYKNFGQTSNKGVELQLDATLLDHKDYGLNVNFNISYNRGKIDKLNSDGTSKWWQSSKWAGSGAASTDDFLIEEGGRLGEVYGYVTEGIYTASDFTFDQSKGTYALKEGVPNSTSITGVAAPGAVKLKVGEDGKPVKQRLGNTIAPWTGGFGINGNYKGFDLGVFCNYSFGNKIVNAAKLASSYYNDTKRNWNLNSNYNYGNRYTAIDPSTGRNLLSSSAIKEMGEEAIVSRLNEINTGVTNWNPVSITKMPLIDQAVENGSYLRINTVTLGYTLPKKWINKFNIQNLRIYVTGYNLYCFTSYSGADPEVDCCTSTPMTPGIDFAAYPKSRSYVGGINLTF